MRGRAERDMPFAREQPGGGVHPDPAGAGHIGLGPGVEIDHVLRNPLGPFDRHDIGGELDRIARDEPRRETELAQELHHQPRRIAARSGADAQRLLGRLDARLHADDVADRLVHRAVDLDQEVDRPHFDVAEAIVQRVEQRALRLELEIGRQIGLEIGRVGERPPGGIVLDEEVERIDHHQIGDQVHRHAELAGRLGHDDSRQPVAVRILLPVDEMLLGQDRQRIIGNGGPAVRCGTQPDRLRAQHDRVVVAIRRQMVERSLNHVRACSTAPHPGQAMPLGDIFHHSQI